MTDFSSPLEREAQRKRGLYAISMLRKALDTFTFAGTNEAAVQKQVIVALTLDHSFGGIIEVVGSEVTEVLFDGELGRFDVVVNVLVDGTAVRVVIELKVKGTAEAAERQAQRYAKTDAVDAVVIATSSNRLARGIAVGGGGAIVHQTLGGKPFGVVYLRPF